MEASAGDGTAGDGAAGEGAPPWLDAATGWDGALELRSRLRDVWHVVLTGLIMVGFGIATPMGLASDLFGLVFGITMGLGGLWVLAVSLSPSRRARLRVDAQHLSVRQAGRERRIALADIDRISVHSIRMSPHLRIEHRSRRQLSRRQWWFSGTGIVTVGDVYGPPVAEIGEEIRRRARAAGADV